MSVQPWQRAYGDTAQESPQTITLADIFTPAPEPEPDWEKVWSLLTEPRQSGLGEGPITEAWMPRGHEEEPPESEPDEKKDDYNPFTPRPKTSLEEWFAQQQQRAAAWQEEVEKQFAGARTPEIRYDLRHHDYFHKLSEARKKSVNALVDPYTHLLAEFGDIDIAAPAWDIDKTRTYAFAAGANLEVARLHIARWHLRGAEAALKRAAKADPHDPDIWWHLGIVQLLRRKTRGAIEAFKLAWNYRPGDPRNRVALGLAHYHDKDYANAATCFDYEKGPDRIRAGARSFLVCCYRMQEKWDQARMEIERLSQSPIDGWKEMAAQCSRCVDRGQGLTQKKTSIPLKKLAKIGLFLAVLLFWVFMSWGEIADLAEKVKGIDPKAVVWPATIILLAIANHLKRAFKKDDEEIQYGDGEEDLPCWQTRTWMRPPRLDIFGQHAEISRK